MADSIRKGIMKALLDKLGELKHTQTYPSVMSSVEGFDKDVNVESKFNTPLLMVIDTGNEKLIVDDGVQQRFELEIILRVFIKTDTEQELLGALSDAVATVKQYIFSGATIHSKVLALIYSETQSNRFHPDGSAADTLIGAKLIYVNDQGSY